MKVTSLLPLLLVRALCLEECDASAELQTVHQRVMDLKNAADGSEEIEESQPWPTKDAVEAGTTVCKQGVQSWNSFSDGEVIKGTTHLLGGLAPVAGLVLAEPEALLVAGGLGMIGGLFGSEGDAGISNEDLLDTMQEGFRNISIKLDEMDMKLDSMQRQLTEMQLQLQVLQATMTTYVVGQLSIIQDISGEFRNILQLGDAARKAPDLHMRDFKRQIDFAVVTYGKELYPPAGCLSAGNLANVLRDPAVSICDAGDFYKQVIAARYEMFFMMQMNEYFKDSDTISQLKHLNASQIKELQQHRADAASTLLAQLSEQLETYKKTAENLRPSPEQFLRWAFRTRESCQAACMTAECNLGTRVGERTWCLWTSGAYGLEGTVEKCHQFGRFVLNSDGYVQNFRNSYTASCLTLLAKNYTYPKKSAITLMPCKDVADARMVFRMTDSGTLRALDARLTLPHVPMWWCLTIDFAEGHVSKYSDDYRLGTVDCADPDALQWQAITWQDISSP
ncbi:unnamed protein product [Symbiodinium natans]|uniref:Apple domain-containing protein n=1 Tax=Symbiodinium natans TaxID=878477 RepID=A0A812HV32_9DINO|nr:unnamed protein product [Symbiodinium natans]